MTAVEVYLPLLQVAGFLAAWGVSMFTGLMFSQVL